jgi:DNA mismatch endonuclease (patch repair protein)
MGEVSLATRHVMQANKSKNTGPELLVRRALREAGLRNIIVVDPDEE